MARLVPYSRLLYLERSGCCRDASSREVAVTDDKPSAVRLDFYVALFHEGFYFALQCRLEQLPGSLTDVYLEDAAAILGDR